MALRQSVFRRYLFLCMMSFALGVIATPIIGCLIVLRTFSISALNDKLDNWRMDNPHFPPPGFHHPYDESDSQRGFTIDAHWPLVDRFGTPYDKFVIVLAYGYPFEAIEGPLPLWVQSYGAKDNTANKIEIIAQLRHPLWKGLAINSAIYGALFGMMISVARRGRLFLRRRRGLCPVCKYDLRGSAGECPECGRPSRSIR